MMGALGMQNNNRASLSEHLSATQMTDFIRFCERAGSRRFADYIEFETFTMQNYRQFWRYFLDWSGIAYSGDPNLVCTSDDCEHAEFFPDLRLNFADNLLAIRDAADAARPALTSLALGRDPVRLTRGELRSRVDRLSSSLQALGVSSEWRIAMVAQSDHAAVTATLAAAALGALVATGSSELSGEANVARLAAFEPSVLFCHLQSPLDSAARKLRELASHLAASLPSLRLIVALDGGEVPEGWRGPFHSIDSLIAAGRDTNSWPRYPFSQPYTVLFTSGTSGPPRGIVHAAGGALLEHLKSLRLHYELRPSDKIFFQASTSWVLWRLHLSMLGVGAEIVLNSAPVSHPETLWKIVADEAITVFGTAPAYLKLCELHGYSPRSHFEFGALRSIIAGGSILEEAHQAWVRSAVKPLTARSGYGSTDVYTGVVLPNPDRPDHPGQLQGRSLGIDVRVVRQGESSFPKPVGELIIANPIPSRPIGYLDDPGGARFHADYFVRNAPYFSLGDFGEFTPEGGARILGRCDSVINIRGTRIGPGEIYRVLRDVPEMATAIAVAQTGDMPGGERLLLFVVLQKGLELTVTLTQSIKDLIRTRLSAAHVPEIVAQVSALPMTHNGKLSERSVADAVSGRPVANRSALSNPECLEEIASHPALRLIEAPLTNHEAADPASQSVESIVQTIWEQVLGRRPIGRDENFFDAGGDSVRAMEVFALLERAIGTSLPISILHQAATVAKLSHLIEQHVVPSADTLVLLGENSGPQPLFMVHGIGGHVMELRSLLRAVDYPGPMYGVQARGVAGDVQPLRSVHEMARTYLEAIRALQPRGPYLIGGYSLGGLVALEMARTLLAEGERVLPLPLLDTLIETKYWRTSVWLQMLRYRLRVLYADIRSTGPREALRISVSRFMSLLEHVMRRYDSNVRRRFAMLYEDDEQLPPTLWAVKEAGIVAVAAYTPRFLDHKIHFFKPADGLHNWCDPATIWSPYVRSIEVTVVPGDHDSMMVAPDREALAEALTGFLRTAVQP
jgi:acetoacetyl-CoA synthetase